MPRGISRFDEAMLQGRLWTPDLLLPALWLDGADQSTITIATGVSQWRDKSGNNRHVTQSATASQPAYQAATFNGRNCLRFDGSNDILTRTAENWAYQYPIAHFAVFRAISLAPAYNSLADFYSDGAGNTGGWTSLIKSNNRSAVYMVATASQPNYDGNGALTYLTNTPYVWSTNMGDRFIQSWGNGRADGSNTGAWTSRTNAGATKNIEIGASSFGRYTNWDIAEQIVLNSQSVGSRSATSRQLIEGYLAWKWGITLDASHPFANRPPLIGDS